MYNPRTQFDFLATNKSQSKKAKSLEQPQVERFLHPQGENGKSRAEVNDRKKHPRLAGAYLYVTRLGWNNNNIAQPNPKKKFVKPSAQVAALSSSSESDPGAFSLPSSASSTARSAILVLCTTSSGVVHQRLLHRFPKKRPRYHEKRYMPLVLATDAFHTCML